MSRDDLFERADRAHAESLRLMTQGPIAVDHTLTMLHEFVLSHEKTLELLGHAIQRNGDIMSYLVILLKRQGFLSRIG